MALQIAKGFFWGGEEKEEQKIELTESFKTHVKSERFYKIGASISFFILVFIVGIPAWWHTTNVYRAPFPVFEQNRSISIPVRILLSTTSKTLEPEIDALLIGIEANLTRKETIQQLDFDFSTEYVGIRDFEKLEADNSLEISRNAEKFEIFISIVPKAEWTHYSATNVRLGRGKWSFVQWPEESKERAASRVTELIWDILLDVPHLTEIVRRDLRQRMQPWQIAALPLSHQKRLVWDSAPLAFNYRIQVIYLHENEAPNSKTERRTAEALRKFGKLVEGITNVEVTSEHLWDFEITRNHLSKDVQERWTLTHSDMEQLVKRVDMQMQTSLELGAVLRIVVLETSEPVVLLDQMGEDSNGLAVAAWGAILARNEQTESRAVAAMRIHMGMDAELLPGWWRPPTALCQWEVSRARLRASVDNAMRSMSAIRALHEMTLKISNLVINDDVASRATRAVALLEDGLKPGRSPNFEKLLEARKLADSANSDHSLLGSLYFPMDQRTAVFVPLAVPIVIPIFKLLWVISKKAIFREFM